MINNAMVARVYRHFVAVSILAGFSIIATLYLTPARLNARELNDQQKKFYKTDNVRIEIFMPVGGHSTAVLYFFMAFKNILIPLYKRNSESLDGEKLLSYRFHLLVDNKTAYALEQLVSTWNLDSDVVQVKFYHINDNLRRRMGAFKQLLVHRGGLMNSARLHFLEIFDDESIEKIISIDYDVLATRDLLELWQEFDAMRRQGASFALAQKIWNRTFPDLIPAFKGRYEPNQIQFGVQGGVTLVDLKSLRSLANPSWNEIFDEAVSNLKWSHNEEAMPNQATMNAIFSSHPDMLWLLPCHFNLQVQIGWDATSTFPELCSDDERFNPTLSRMFHCKGNQKLLFLADDAQLKPESPGTSLLDQVETLQRQAFSYDSFEFQNKNCNVCSAIFWPFFALGSNDRTASASCKFHILSNFTQQQHRILEISKNVKYLRLIIFISDADMLKAVESKFLQNTGGKQLYDMENMEWHLVILNKPLGSTPNKEILSVKFSNVLCVHLKLGNCSVEYIK